MNWKQKFIEGFLILLVLVILRGVFKGKDEEDDDRD
jgi:hypothetical protein